MFLLAKHFSKIDRLASRRDIEQSNRREIFRIHIARKYLKRNRERIRSRGLVILKSANTACLVLVVCGRLSSANAHPLLPPQRYKYKASLVCLSLLCSLFPPSPVIASTLRSPSPSTPHTTWPPLHLPALDDQLGTSALSRFHVSRPQGAVMGCL